MAPHPYSYAKPRNGLAVGDRVRLTKKYLLAYPKSMATTGTLLKFCRGTDLSIQFDAHRYPTQIDERWITRATTAVAAAPAPTIPPPSAQR